MKKQLLLASSLAAITIGLSSSPAFAGNKEQAPVQITRFSVADPNGKVGFARGSIGTARNSADNQQGISCEVLLRGKGSNLSGSVFCSAKNAAGQAATCALLITASNATNIHQALSALTERSLLQFSWNSQGACVDVTVRSASLDERSLL